MQKSMNAQIKKGTKHQFSKAIQIETAPGTKFDQSTQLSKDSDTQFYSTFTNNSIYAPASLDKKIQYSHTGVQMSLGQD